jgi:protease YdgD
MLRTLSRLAVAGLGFALTLAGPPVWAQQTAGMLPKPDHADWQAIGRLNTIGYYSVSMCTGTLIAPDRVLTAAHCVLTGYGAPIPAREFRFLAGWLQGGYRAVGRVARVETSPEAEAQMAVRGLSPVEDLAILHLSQPVEHVVPLAAGAVDADAPLRILGYRQDRPHALSDSGSCPRRPAPDGILLLDCPVTFGTSGAPVLQAGPDGWRVVGVVSGITRAGTVAGVLRPDFGTP